METQEVISPGLTPADQRKSTDSILLIFCVIYFIPWLFIAFFAATTHGDIGLANPEDESIVPYGTWHQVKDEDLNVFFDTEDKDRSLRTIMRLGMQGFFNRMTQNRGIRIFTTIVNFIICAVFYFAMVLYFSKVAVQILAWFPHLVVYLSFFFTVIVMLASILESLAKLVKATSLGHPDPEEHVAFMINDVGILVLSVVLAVIFFKKIQKAIAVIREGSKAAMSLSGYILFVPVAEMLVLVLIELLFGPVAYSLLIMKDSDGFMGCVWLFQGYNLFGYYWMKGSVSAISRMIVSRTAAIYYWTINKYALPLNATSESWNIILSFHTGTAALGSIIATIVKWIRTILRFLRTDLETKGNYSTSSTFEFFKVLFTWILYILMYINRNAYIVCAIHGTKFFYSAKYAIDLIIKNLTLALVTNFLTKLVCRMCLTAVYLFALLIGTIMISISTGLPAIEIIIILNLVTKDIANFVFFVLEVSIETIFLSALEDFERNGGAAATEEFKIAMLAD